ncbi:MAG: hypothetical protein QOD99_1689, partial [Chthoniobacter sp.]|nr:hypothetical protein [Chthoniobacter sp.]
MFKEAALASYSGLTVRFTAPSQPLALLEVEKISPSVCPPLGPSTMRVLLFTLAT